MGGLSNIYNKINEDLKTWINQGKPDVIWVFKGMELFPETLERIKEQKIKIVNYNPDNPFIFSGRGSGNSNITRSISLYDLHFTYNLSIQQRLEREYGLRTSFLPFGFDIGEDLFQKIEKQGEIQMACFLGNPDKERAFFINELAKMNVNIAVYGHHWDSFVNHQNIEVQDAVYGDEQWQVLRKYRVHLNLMRSHNLDSHNMRTFEVPGIGGIMVAPDTTEHRMFFENGKEAFFFKSVAECVQIINDLINLSSEDALKIRNAARQRSITSCYDYKSRAKLALTSMENLLR